jgi:hypothetical protein
VQKSFPKDSVKQRLELQISLALARQLSSTLIDFELVETLANVNESLYAFDQP